MLEVLIYTHLVLADIFFLFSHKSSIVTIATK
jgi:hypothetical protein